MIYFLLGSIILFLTVRDVFEALLMPRRELDRFRPAPFLIHHLLWPAYRNMACLVSSARWRTEILGLFAPLVFIVVLSIWVFFLILGFGLILFASANQTSPPIKSLYSAVYVAGTSLLTIGFGDYVGKSAGVRFLLLTAAFSGMIITASAVSLIFTLIGFVHRREVLVSITMDIAGSPPSGITILEAYAKHTERQSLNDFYHDWHVWCADVSLSHRAYLILPYVRSADSVTSWLTALGAVLDSAALLLSTNSDAACLSAKLTLQSGKTLINELCDLWGLPYSKGAAAGADELSEICERLQKAGYRTSAGTKDDFLRLRQQYTFAHRALCDYIAVPQTPLPIEHQLSIGKGP